MAHFEIIMLYIFMAAPILFFIGYEISRANRARNLNEIQKYMKKVPLKPYLKNAYVECLFISQRGMVQVYVKEKHKKRRLILLYNNLGSAIDVEDFRRPYWTIVDERAFENTEDLIVADWAMIQRRFSPKTTFKDIHKLVRHRNYYTMYASGELPENPYTQQKQTPVKEVVEEKLIPVEDFQSLIPPQEPAPKPSEYDERRVDL